MEPWDGMRLPPAELFGSLRAEIDTTNRLARGRLDIEDLSTDGVVRWRPEGTASWEVDAGPDYLLGVKWPAYWRYIDLLPSTRFVVCVRHPFETFASFGKAGGRLARGLEYETTFNRRLNDDLRAATKVDIVRRILFYDYVHERILPFLARPNVFVVRYERWFEDPHALVADMGTFLGVKLDKLPVKIRPPAGWTGLTEDEYALIREHCHTAVALGYPLDMWGPAGEGR